MKNYFKLLFFTIFWSNFVSAQSFYDRSVVQTIEIFFTSPTWDTQMDNLAATTEDYLLADSVRINGIVYDSVGVKYKGNSSYNPNNQKNPIHISLDWVHGSYDYQGYTDVKLQNGYMDPSMIREVLSYAILEQYMDCPKANFANVYINGSLRGLYSNAESINDKFNGDHYYSVDGSFFKCNPLGGAGPGAQSSPDLKWINADSTSYYNGYELKSNYGWTDLVNLINTLNNNFTQIESILDVDRALWMLAFNNVLVNLDSYSGAFRQNYYLYKDLNDRFITTIWDLNMSFAGFPGGTGSGTYTATTLDPMSNSTSTIHPLIVKMMANPMYKRMYMAHLRTIVQEMFASGAYLTEANSIRTTINTSVQLDPYKFYTYTQFQNSLTTSVAGGGPMGSTIPGIQALMDARVSYFNTNANYLLVAPSLISYAPSTPNPTYGQTITFTVTCSNETTVYFGYRYNHSLKFNRVQMFDDGLHNDGSAGDHVYGIDIPMNCYVLEYYFYLDNNVAGLFSPQRAEHEFHTLLVTMPVATSGNVLINELMADNTNTALDSNGESADWIELWNTTSSLLDLQGLYLSDDPLLLTKWQFPVGSGIQPNEYKIVWIDKDTNQFGLHANFKLNNIGETIYFSDGVAVFDQVTYPYLGKDSSYARCPDGGAFALTSPTFASANNCYLDLSADLQANAIKLYPVPTMGDLVLEVAGASKYECFIYDMLGRFVLKHESLETMTIIPTSKLKEGCYHLLVTDVSGKTVHVSFVKQ